MNPSIPPISYLDHSEEEAFDSRIDSQTGEPIASGSQAAVKIVIMGRPNVGKSTLFNRLIGKRRALVHPIPGVTRDRLEGKTHWWRKNQAYPITLVDTGGLGIGPLSQEIEHQVRIAMQEADFLFWVVDAQTGLLPQDEELLQDLASSGLLQKIPVILVVNKIDVEKHEIQLAEFFSLGIDPVLPVSAEHGRGIDDLKDIILDRLEKTHTNINPILLQTQKSPPRIAVLGRPNVGKSTLVNALLGEERMITSPIPGTTSDSIDSPVFLNEHPFILMDTAGIRRKNKTEQGIEVLSVVQTRKSLEQADIALLVLDGEHGVSDQDEKLSGLIDEVGCAVILVVNKWDTQAGKKWSREDAAEHIRKKMAHLRYAPLMFVSALKKSGFEELGHLMDDVLHQRYLKISTHEFTEWVRQESTIHNPKNAKFFLCHQAGKNPPTFVCHVNDPEKIHFSLKRHLINAIRERWGYMGNPIRLLFVEAKRRSLPRKQKTSRKSHKLSS